MAGSPSLNSDGSPPLTWSPSLNSGAPPLTLGWSLTVFVKYNEIAKFLALSFFTIRHSRLALGPSPKPIFTQIPVEVGGRNLFFVHFSLQIDLYLPAQKLEKKVFLSKSFNIYETLTKQNKFVKKFLWQKSFHFSNLLAEIEPWGQFFLTFKNCVIHDCNKEG